MRSSSDMSPRNFFPLAIMVTSCFVSSATFSHQPEIVFLKGAPRLNNATYTDFFFCCNVIGDFLQWQYEDEPLSGFRVGDVGRVFVDVGSEREYTATLLSSQSNEQQEAMLDSVLVVSFRGGHPHNFSITCRSHLSSMTVSAQNVSAVLSTATDHEKNVALDHVVSGRIVKTKRNTHIFTCGTLYPLQFIDVNGPQIGFSGSDYIGRARTLLTEDGHVVNIQGILLGREPYQTTTLIFVADDVDVRVTCFFNQYRANLTASHIVTTEEPTVLSSPTTMPTSTTGEVFSDLYTSDPVPITSKDTTTIIIIIIIIIIILFVVLPTLIVLFFVFAIFKFYRRSVYPMKDIIRPHEQKATEQSTGNQEEGIESEKNIGIFCRNHEVNGWCCKKQVRDTPMIRHTPFDEEKQPLIQVFTEPLKYTSSDCLVFKDHEDETKGYKEPPKSEDEVSENSKPEEAKKCAEPENNGNEVDDLNNTSEHFIYLKYTGILCKDEKVKAHKARSHENMLHVANTCNSEIMPAMVASGNFMKPIHIEKVQDWIETTTENLEPVEARNNVLLSNKSYSEAVPAMVVAGNFVKPILVENGLEATMESPKYGRRNRKPSSQSLSDGTCVKKLQKNKNESQHVEKRKKTSDACRGFTLILFITTLCHGIFP